MKILILLFTLLLTFSVQAQQKAEAVIADDVILRVEVEGGNSLALKAADLAKLPRGKTTINSERLKAEFEGVELREVLKLAGAKLGNNQLRGKEMTTYLLVEAADGYKAVFALAELDAEFVSKSVMLADKRDGKPLSGEEGRLRLVVPDEKKHARWVRQVVALKVKKAQ
jgi:DMSO/TMAO reductase YedYZ molybdopterin-dependent catalytic subunit